MPIMAKVTVKLEIETDGNESEMDFLDDEAWLALLDDHSMWFVTSVTSKVEATCHKGAWE